MNSKSSDRILVLSDDQSNGEMIVNLLDPYFADVHLASDPSGHCSAMATVRPAVTVLALRALADARQFAEGLPANLEDPRGRPSGIVALCDKNHIEEAFALCLQGLLDDYVPFWPVSYDGWRLPMAVTSAARLRPRDSLRAEPCAGAEAADRPPLHRALESHLVAESEAVAKAMREILAARSDEPTWDHRTDTVLVVEDDLAQHELLNWILADTQWTPAFATTTASAWQLLRSVRPSVILMDVNLPDGSGLDFVAKMRSHWEFRDIPVITITGESTRPMVIAAITAGAIDFVAKPFSRTTLLEKLGRARQRTPSSFALETGRYPEAIQAMPAHRAG